MSGELHAEVLRVVEDLARLDPDADSVLGKVLSALATAVENYEKAPRSETAHTDHPSRHFDRTCPGCIAEAGAHPYCERCEGPAMSVGGCKHEECPIKAGKEGEAAAQAVFGNFGAELQKAKDARTPSAAAGKSLAEEMKDARKAWWDEIGQSGEPTSIDGAFASGFREGWTVARMRQIAAAGTPSSASEKPCATCNDDPAVCATVPGLRHCEKATRSEARRMPICEDHRSGALEWPDLTEADDACAACRIFYLEAQESLLEEWQQRAKRAEETVAEVQRPLDAQMARLNETVTRLNSERDEAQAHSLKMADKFGALVAEVSKQAPAALAVAIFAAAKASPTSATAAPEYICKCGVRVVPHKCSTGTDF